MRNSLSLMPAGSFARSVEAITASVAAFAGSLDYGWPMPLGATLSAGQLPA